VDRPTGDAQRATVVVVVDDGVADRGVGIPNLARLETLGWSIPAGPFENASRMFCVTFCSLQIGVVGGSGGHASRSRGDQPNVAAVKTPAPLGTVYHVLSANEFLPRHVTGEWARIWMFAGVGALGVTRSYSFPTILGTRSPLVNPEPSNIHIEASPTTQSASTGLHS